MNVVISMSPAARTELEAQFHREVNLAANAGAFTFACGLVTLVGAAIALSTHTTEFLIIVTSITGPLTLLCGILTWKRYQTLSNTGRLLQHHRSSHF